jgi:hypothetical protein
MTRPETGQGIQRAAQRIVRISGMPAFLMMTCRRATREADPQLTQGTAQAGRYPAGGDLRTTAAALEHHRRTPHAHVARSDPGLASIC